MFYPSIAKKLRHNQTNAEIILWQHLRKKQLGNFKFRRQHPIGKYIVDFVCIEAKLIIELDGGQHMDQIDADHLRTKWLNAEGYKVLRFWNNEIFENITSVKEVIGKELGMF